MADLPIAFVTFKRVVLTAFRGEKLTARVERTGSDWCLYLSDGRAEMAIPPVKALMTSEDAARQFALSAYGQALAEFEAKRQDDLDALAAASKAVH